MSETIYDLDDGMRYFEDVTRTMAGGEFKYGNQVETDSAREIEDGCTVLATLGHAKNLYRYFDREGVVRLEPFRSVLKTRIYKKLPERVELIDLPPVFVPVFKLELKSILSCFVSREVVES